MAQEELIDTLVSNEQLGIGKKTSVFKLMFICLVVLVVGFLAYTFFMKSKPEQEQPALSLGASITPPVSQPIKPAEPSVIPPQQQIATAPVIQPDAAQTQPIQAVLNTASQPVAAAGLTQTPVKSVATQQTQPVAPQPIQPTSAIAPSVPTTPSQPVVAQAVQPAQMAQAVLQPVVMEPVIPAVEHLPIKKKPVVRKKPAVKVQTNNSTVAEETHAPAIPMEEGVTREEIIVIQ